MKTKTKSIDYILGFVTGISIMVAVWSCTSPLNADSTYSASDGPSGKQWDPIYVKVVDQVSEALWDLTHMVDFVIRMIMMLTIIWGIIYWIRGPR